MLAGWMLLVAALDCTDTQEELAVGIGTKASAVSAAQLLAPKLCDPVVWQSSGLDGGG